MIIGIDLGNYSTKTSEKVIFASKCTNTSLLGTNPFTTDSGTFYIGEGSHDTEYRKVKKANIRTLFLYALAQSTVEVNNSVVVGLPISQYKADGGELKQLLLHPRMNTVVLNGSQRKLYIEDIEIYPEGLISTEDGILVDIGGRTTEVTLVENMKVVSSFSLPAGTMNLYSDFVNVVNARYGLDLKQGDAERIIRNGLKVNGVDTDVTFAQEVFRVFVDELVGQLQVK